MRSVIANVITVIIGLFRGSGICLRLTFLQDFFYKMPQTLHVRLSFPKLFSSCLAPEGPC